jgi:hypothetical protein
MHNNNVNDISLLKQLNNTATKNRLLEMEDDLINGDLPEDLEDPSLDFSNLSEEEVSRLVEMITAFVWETGKSDMDSITDYAYDLVSDIPGLEDEYSSSLAVEKIIKAYLQNSKK